MRMVENVYIALLEKRKAFKIKNENVQLKI